jgi:SAM-dependent methyltransferase
MPGTPSYELTRCPVCDALDNVEIADADAMRSEVELLWEFHQRRLDPAIPPEALTDRLAFSQHPPIRLSQCSGCTHLYRNPWERKEALKAAYADQAPPDDLLRSLFESQRSVGRAQVNRLTAAAGKPGRGLEVGSYAGGFLAAARDAGWNFEGVDVSPRASAFATEQGLRVTEGEIEAIDPNQVFDAVAVWNTFEQLYDTRSALSAARNLLRKGGVLALRIPNGGFFVRWRRRLHGPLAGIALRLLAHNNLLSFPYRQGFTESSMTRLLEQRGFRIVSASGDALVPVADRWTTRLGTWEERWVKRLQRLTLTGWRAPWVEIYACPTFDER